MAFLGWVIPTLLLIVVIWLQLQQSVTQSRQRDSDFLWTREIVDKQKEHSSMLYELLEIAKYNRDCIGFLQSQLNKIEVDIESLKRELRQ